MRTHLLVPTILFWGLTVPLGVCANGAAVLPRIHLEIFPESPQVIGGTDTNVYLRLRNDGDKVWEASVPHPKQYEMFPSELFEVRRNGVKLPYSKSPAVDVMFAPSTCLRPNETLLLRVPLSRLARFNREIPFGRFDVQVKPRFFRAGYTEQDSITFTWAQRTDSPPTDLRTKLGSVAWEFEAGEQVRLDGTTELLQLIEDSGVAPLLRRRAVFILLKSPSQEELSSLFKVAKVDGVVGLAVAEALRERTLSPGWLLGLLSHPDLGVRRAAATGLASTRMSYMNFVRLLDRREHECDGVIRSDLEIAIIKAARDLPAKDLPFPSATQRSQATSRPEERKGDTYEQAVVKS